MEASGIKVRYLNRYVSYNIKLENTLKAETGFLYDEDFQIKEESKLNFIEYFCLIGLSVFIQII